jgi:hypothetical protein
MTDRRDSTEPPPPRSERYSHIRKRCEVCHLFGMHRSDDGRDEEHGEYVDGRWVARHLAPATTEGPFITARDGNCVHGLPKLGYGRCMACDYRDCESAPAAEPATNGHAVELAGASVAHASAGAVQRLHYEPRDAADVLLNPPKLPASDPTQVEAEASREEQLRSMLEMSRKTAKSWHDLVTALLVSSEWMSPAVDYPADHLQLGLQQWFDAQPDFVEQNAALKQQLAEACADRDRWAERVKLLAARIRMMLDVAEGKHDP